MPFRSVINMKRNTQKYIALAVNIFTVLILFLLRYSGLATLAIGQAVPITLLPLVVAIAIFFGEWLGATAGFFVGALMDTVMSGSYCFNTITVMFIGLIAGVLASYYLNKNIRSATCLSLGAAVTYLFVKQIFFYSFKGISIGAEYYTLYFIPTAVYTALFIIPFYFLERKLKKL